MSGVLTLVGTPIGNLGDMAPRAVEALVAADVICCEDTRRTGRLLQHFGVERPRLVVINEHTEALETARGVKLLDDGRRVAVVTDAGMPGISDPGERLVAAAIEAGHSVEVLPGPSAAVAALGVSGLPAGRFVFEGFLPRKGSARAERLAVVSSEPRTVVLYEAPHRVARTLRDLVAVCGGSRPVVVAPAPAVAVVGLPSGYIAVLPTGYRVVTVSGARYYYVGGIHYRATFYQGRTCYVRVRL